MRKIIKIKLLTILFLLSAVVNYAQDANTYLKNNNDDPDITDKEWCYLNKSTTVIGVPFQPDVTQVTYDGALYTRYAELCFFYGKQNKPLYARQKNFFKGWIPIVEYSWKENDIRYEIEMFCASLDGRSAANTVNFVKVRIKNTGKSMEKYQFSSAIRGKKDDYRFGDLKGYNLSSSFSMNDKGAWHDDSLLYYYNPIGKRCAIIDHPYAKPFSNENIQLTEKTPVCTVRYSGKLDPQKEVELIFKMPRIPVAKNESDFLRQIDHADYDHYRKNTVSYWENMLNKQTSFEIPEVKVQNAQKASMVHLMLATRTMPNGSKMQTDGLPYPMFFLTSGAQMVLAYLQYGLKDYARLIVDNSIKQQEPDGLYFDRSLAHGGLIPAAHGQVMYISGIYYLHTRDANYGKKIFGSVKKAVEYLEKSINEDEYGLLPPTYPYDNEMIDGHYLSNNLWALMGLRYAIRLAKGIGENNDATKWTILELKYRNNILKGLEKSITADGYIPTGLYGFLTGEKARRHFKTYQTNSDWENMLLLYPVELLKPADKRVSTTLQHIRQGYAEGIMTYRHGQHLHQYITANMIEQYMVQGESRQALIDFYHLLLHSGSTHEGFENLVEPWKDRMVSSECPPPHAWAAAKTACLISNFLVYTYGGENGIEPEKSDLYLFSVLSPEWTKAGKKISINNAPTESGNVTAGLSFQEKSAKLSLHLEFKNPPRTIRVKIPYFKKIISVETDAHQYAIENGYIVFSSDLHNATIFWDDNTNAHLHTVENLLNAYRSTNLFTGTDSVGAPIIKKQEPFLLKQEKSEKRQPLSFEQVRRTFLYEFYRRQNEKVVEKTQATLNQ